jgi:hypothetical protein
MEYNAGGDALAASTDGAITPMPAPREAQPIKAQT